jgi:enoyl-CoA hydratase/carnithine racemase
VENDPGKTATLGTGPAGMPARTDVLARLSRVPLVSIASIRGRARGAGSESVLACDLRFASRENTLLGQFEVGIGVVPEGNPMTGLSRLVGRGRALEIVLVAHDFDGPRAEQYGYVNRVIDDQELDGEVNRIASRLARFDHDAIARTKSCPDQVTLPADASCRPPSPFSASRSGVLPGRCSWPGSKSWGSTPTATRTVSGDSARPTASGALTQTTTDFREPS